MIRQLDSRWSGVKLHSAVVVVVALSLLLENPAATLMLGGALCAATYLALGLIEARRAPLWFSPLSFYFLWYSVGLGLSALYVGSVVSTGEWLDFSAATVPPPDVALAYVIYLVGSVALHAGLQFFRPARLDVTTNERDPGAGRLGWLAGLWALGLWAVWNPSPLVSLGTAGRTLQWASLAALSAFTLTRHRFGLSPTIFATLLGIGVAGVFAANLMTYSKAYLMYSFFPLVWLCVVRPSLRRWVPALGAAMVVFYLTVVAPVVTMARLTPLGESETPGERLVTTFQAWTRAATDLVDRSFYWEQVDAFLVRQFDPIPVGYLVGEIRTYGFQLGATMEYVRYAFVPRILWPEKPTVTRGAWFTTYTGFAPSEEEATGAAGITATGELYWNFGLPGLVAGMCLIGCLLGGLWRMAGADPHREPLNLMLYVILMLSMPNMSEAGSVFVSIAANFVIFKAAFLAVAVIRRPEPAGHVSVT